MGSNDGILQFSERVIERQWFLIKHIQPGSGDRSVLQRFIEHEFILKTGLSGEKREAWASPEASV